MQIRKSIPFIGVKMYYSVWIFEQWINACSRKCLERLQHCLIWIFITNHKACSPTKHVKTGMFIIFCAWENKLLYLCKRFNLHSLGNIFVAFFGAPEIDESLPCLSLGHLLGPLPSTFPFWYVSLPNYQPLLQCPKKWFPRGNEGFFSSSVTFRVLAIPRVSSFQFVVKSVFHSADHQTSQHQDYPISERAGPGKLVAYSAAPRKLKHSKTYIYSVENRYVKVCWHHV